MSILKQLLNRGCTHRFAWPRVDATGQHYQICLSCGTAYEYDWKKMQRSTKLLAQSVQHAEMFTRAAFLKTPQGFVSK